MKSTHDEERQVRFLAVEDEENDVTLLRRFLSPYISEFNASGRLSEALALCKSKEFDVILLDLRLLDSNVDTTRSAIRELKELQPDAALVVVSGMPVPNLEELVIMDGADRFVRKDDKLFENNAKALVMAINVALLHHVAAARPESFWPHVKLLREMAES